MTHALGIDGQPAVTDFGRPEKAQEAPMTVWIYVDTSKKVGEKDHLKVFTTEVAALAQGKRSGRRCV
jgi:hypothetical protein